jgi:trypsin
VLLQNNIECCCTKYNKNNTSITIMALRNHNNNNYISRYVNKICPWTIIILLTYLFLTYIFTSNDNTIPSSNNDNIRFLQQQNNDNNDKTTSSSTISNIIGGKDTNITKLPHQVALVGTNGLPFCGGTILASRWVLTAQHCSVKQSGVRVFAGVTNVIDINTQPLPQYIQMATVSKWFSSPNYFSVQGGCDVALLYLDFPGFNVSNPNNEFVHAVKWLPRSLAHSLLAVGRPGIISGWGVMSNAGDIYATILQSAEIPITSQQVADGAYNLTIPIDQFPAGTALGGVDTCQGDSGGPFTVTSPITGERLVGGITSWGKRECGLPLTPGIYTRVSDYEEFIALTLLIHDEEFLSSISGGGGSSDGEIRVIQPGLQFSTVPFVGEKTWYYQQVQVPNNVRVLSVRTFSGQGDVDLYVSWLTQPLAFACDVALSSQACTLKGGRVPEELRFAYECISKRNGNTEWCDILLPPAGIWYVGLFGYSDSAQIVLQVNYEVFIGGVEAPVVNQHHSSFSSSHSNNGKNGLVMILDNIVENSNVKISISGGNYNNDNGEDTSGGSTTAGDNNNNLDGGKTITITIESSYLHLNKWERSSSSLCMLNHTISTCIIQQPLQRSSSSSSSVSTHENNNQGINTLNNNKMLLYIHDPQSIVKQQQQQRLHVHYLKVLSLVPWYYTKYTIAGNNNKAKFQRKIRIDNVRVGTIFHAKFTSKLWLKDLNEGLKILIQVNDQQNKHLQSIMDCIPTPLIFKDSSERKCSMGIIMNGGGPVNHHHHHQNNPIMDDNLMIARYVDVTIIVKGNLGREKLDVDIACVRLGKKSVH